MNWIRIDRGITRDVAILRMARALGVCRAEVVGLVVNVLAQVPDHAPTGDLSTLDDTDMELWADWQREPGAFAAAFRAHLCTEAGVIRSWEKHNGAAMREASASRERAKTYRERRKAAREAERDANAGANENVTVTRTRDVRVTSREPNALRHVLRDETRRDVITEISVESEISAQSTHLAKAPKTAPRATRDDGKYPHWPTEDRRAKHAHWQAELGPVAWGPFVAALGPIFNGDALASCTAAERQQAFSSYVSSAKAGGSGSRFVSPAQCAKLFGAIVQAWRDHADDPIARIARIDTIVHGRPLA